MNDTLKVPIGTTTLAGYGATLVGVIGILLVQVLHVDEEQATLIATAVFTVVSFAITQFGRYKQAQELAKSKAIAQAVVAAAPNAVVTPAVGSPGSLPQGAAADPDDMDKVGAELDRLQNHP